MTASLTTTSNATELRFTGWASKASVFYKMGVLKWGEAVQKATNGRVTINFLPKPAGSVPAHYDLVKDGVADAGYYIPAITKGRFVLHKAAEFPFLGDSAVANSVAYWRIYKKYFEKAGEHKGLLVITGFTLGPGMIHNSKRPVKSAADLKGLKLRVPGATIGDLAKDLGAIPMHISFPQVQQSIAKKIADGVFLPFNAINSLKLAKYQPYTTTVPGGLYNLVFHVGVNHNAWKKVSAADQKAIMKIAGGEAGAIMFGKSWDHSDSLGRAYVKKEKTTVTTMTPKFQAEIVAAFSKMRNQWLVDAKAAGVDGKAALANQKTELAKLNAK